MKPTIRLAALGLALALPTLCFGTTYQLTDVGFLTGGNNSQAYGINNSGQVVGWSNTSLTDPTPHAFLYSNGAMTDLGAGYAYGINDGGEVVGNADTAFLYSNGVRHDLGTLGGPDSNAVGINDSGEVVGNADTGNGTTHAFLYTGGPLVDLGTLAGYQNSYAYGINQNGQIVGAELPTGGDQLEAFRYSGGTMNDLPLGGVGGAALAINANGQIAGFAIYGSNNHAILYDNGITTDLGNLGYPDAAAYGINSFGDVVGYSYPPGGGSTEHAFIYTDGTMLDLNNLLNSSGAGWTLVDATGINDNGQIVGYGTNPLGQQDSFLLTPVPEPASGFLAATGLLGLLAWGCRRSPSFLRRKYEGR